MSAPIAVALDAPDLETLAQWSYETSPYVSTLKVGLEVFCRDGAQAVHAARAVRDLRPDFLTVHAAGGAEMITAAVNALPDTRITAVTVLTSLDDSVLESIGMRGPSLEAAVRLAVLAVSAGARAIVCSPLEVAAIRAAVPNDITLITPGVRPAGAGVQDQKRVATPESALAAGADLLVIGRPITGAEQPGAAAKALRDALPENT